MATVTHIPFQFDEASHTYTADGATVLSVTQVLSDIGYSNIEAAERFNPEALERKRQIGKLVHQACHYHDENDLPLQRESVEAAINALPEVIACRVRGYVQFRNDTGYAPVINEGRHIGEVYGMRYGMQFDSIGQYHGKGPWVLVDLKNASGSPQRSWALQLAAYAMGQKILENVTYSQIVRVIVQLLDEPLNGKLYRIFSSSDRTSKIFQTNDFQIWQAALAVAIDKNNHRIERR